MTHDDETYDERRIEALRGMLRELAQRILDLDREERLLQNGPELLRRMGDLRSELFHYEVRATYDTPEVAESRRIVNDAIQQAEQRNTWQSSEGTEDGDDAPEW